MDTLSIVIDWVLTHTESWHRQGWISTQLCKDVVEAVCVGCVVCCVCVCGGGCARIVHVWCPCVCVCVFGRGVGEPRPLKCTILTQTGCTFIFMKDIQLTIYIIFSGLQRSTRPVIASPQVSVPLISWLVDSSRKGGTTPIHAESGCDCQTIDSMVKHHKTCSWKSKLNFFV